MPKNFSGPKSVANCARKWDSVNCSTYVKPQQNMFLLVNTTLIRRWQIESITEQYICLSMYGLICVVVLRGRSNKRQQILRGGEGLFAERRIYSTLSKLLINILMNHFAFSNEISCKFHQRTITLLTDFWMCVFWIDCWIPCNLYVWLVGLFAIKTPSTRSRVLWKTETFSPNTGTVHT